MRLTESNYEAFFLDYWEGNLSNKDKKHLAGFLDQNPNLLDEFLDFKVLVSYKLQPNCTKVFANRDSLKKQIIRSYEKIDEDNYENWIIAHLEKDLNENDEKTFDAFLNQNKHLKNEINLFKLTFLKPEKNVCFPAKNGLKHGQSKLLKKPLFIAFSIAAAVLLLFTLIFLPGNKNNPNQLTTGKFRPNPILVEHIPYAKSETMLPINPKVRYPELNHIHGKNEYEKIAQNTKAQTNQSNGDFEKTTANPAIENHLASMKELNPDRMNTIQMVSIFKIEYTGKLAANSLLRPLSRKNDIDFLLAEDQPKNGLLKRIAKNAAHRIFNFSNEDEEAASLFTEVTQKGIETFHGLKNFANTTDRKVDENKPETIYAFGDRLAIRITRGNKQVQNTE
jgi:hypothetical protein